MISGTSQMDGAIPFWRQPLMGQVPQTLEHQLLASQFGIKHIVFYINKVDFMLLDKDTLELVELEVRELL
jgi:elongation factor Tu